MGTHQTNISIERYTQCLDTDDILEIVTAIKMSDVQDITNTHETCKITR